MTLVPCSRCRRHVLIDDHACPFCGTSRWSRIAVLAGALALPACGGAKTAAQPPVQVENSPTPPVEQSFPRVATAKITGVVMNTRTNSPLVGDLVYLVSPDGDERHVATDETGRYEFGSLVAGDYVVRVHVDARRRNVTTPGDRITVKVGETVEHDMKTFRMDPRVKMPYGAPPARSRMV